MSSFLQRTASLFSTKSEEEDEGSGSDGESVLESGSFEDLGSNQMTILDFDFVNGKSGIFSPVLQKRHLKIGLFTGLVCELKGANAVKRFAIKKFRQTTVSGQTVVVRKMGSTVSSIRTKKYKFDSESEAFRFHYYVMTRNEFGVHLIEAFKSMVDFNTLHRASVIAGSSAQRLLVIKGTSDEGPDHANLTISKTSLKTCLKHHDIFANDMQVEHMFTFIGGQGGGIDFMTFYHLLWHSPVYSTRECLLHWMSKAEKAFISRGIARDKLLLKTVEKEISSSDEDSEDEECEKGVNLKKEEDAGGEDQAFDDYDDDDGDEAHFSTERTKMSSPLGCDYGLKFDQQHLENLQGEDIMMNYEAVRAIIHAGKEQNTSSIFINGTLFVTNFRICIISNTPIGPEIDQWISHSRYWHLDVSKYWKVFNIPLAALHSIQPFETDCIQFVCKDLRTVRLYLPSSDRTPTKQNSLVSFISSAAFPGADYELIFAYNYRPDYSLAISHNEYGEDVIGSGQWKTKPLGFNAWDLSNMSREWQRQQLTGTGRWRLFDNSNYEVAPTYPPVICVPSEMTDDEIIAAAKWRSKGRFPAITYMHATSGAVMVRSSQPMLGVMGSVCDEDKKLLMSYRLHQGTQLSMKQQAKFPFYILDARGYLAATANRAAGKGTEDKTQYENTDLEYQNIGNIHDMRKSLNLLSDTVMPGGFGEVGSCLHSKLEQSGWLSHISLILQASINGAERLHVQQSSILCHCSDGWDRTAQICALIQIILDPYFRTIEGLAVLIEKDWCAFGHKFEERFGCYNAPTVKPDERSPVFLQFIECIWQITMQYPAAFEYNEELLVYVADHVQSGQFGNFLTNCFYERHEVRQVKSRTRSIWEYIFYYHGRFVNPHYIRLTKPVWPSTTLKTLTVWNRYYSRWSPLEHPRPGSGKVWDDSYI